MFCDVLARLDRVLSQQPTLIFLFIGINDAWHAMIGHHATSSELFLDALSEVVSNLVSAGVLLVVCIPSVIGERPRGDNPCDHYLDEYASIVRRMAKQQMEVGLCDLRHAFLAYLQQHKCEDTDRGELTIHSTGSSYESKGW